MVTLRERSPGGRRSVGRMSEGPAATAGEKDDGAAGGGVPAVTLHVWRLPARRIPRALAHMATDRRALAGTPGLTFAKSLGCGSGRSFAVRDATPTRWALLCCWTGPAAAAAAADSPVLRAWDRVAVETWRCDLVPLTSRGRWSGHDPFPRTADPRDHADNPVVALTRARLRVRTIARFWRAVPPVAADLWGGDGPRPSLALGVGEAPVGVQGTVSVWPSAADLAAFAYGRSPHRAAIEQTRVVGWYAEELFARLAVTASAGTVDGRDPVAGWSPPAAASAGGAGAAARTVGS